MEHAVNKLLKKKIPPSAWMSLSVVSVVCCQVEVCATGRMLLQRSPTSVVCLECVPKAQQ